MLTVEQLQYLGLTASHRAFAFEARANELERQCQHYAKALQEAEALIERLRKGEPPAASDATAIQPDPLPPLPPIEAPPDDDGVAASLDAMAQAIVAEPA